MGPYSVLTTLKPSEALAVGISSSLPPVLDLVGNGRAPQFVSQPTGGFRLEGVSRNHGILYMVAPGAFKQSMLKPDRSWRNTLKQHLGLAAAAIRMFKGG